MSGITSYNNYQVNVQQFEPVPQGGLGPVRLEAAYEVAPLKSVMNPLIVGGLLVLLLIWQRR